MAIRIVFTCAECQELFEEPVQAFVKAPAETAWAPALCRRCGEHPRCPGCLDQAHANICPTCGCDWMTDPDQEND